MCLRLCGSQVWPRHKSNLVIVERYHFFPTSRGEFNLAGPGLVEQRRDEVAPEDQGGLLLSMAALLERLWAGFYAKMVRPLLLLLPPAPPLAISLELSFHSSCAP